MRGILRRYLRKIRHRRGRGVAVGDVAAGLRVTGVHFWGEWKENGGGMAIRWEGERGGGEVAIFKGRDGRLWVESEVMGLEFVSALLMLLVLKYSREYVPDENVGGRMHEA
jgi:hypothetical protein